MIDLFEPYRPATLAPYFEEGWDCIGKLSHHRQDIRAGPEGNRILCPVPKTPRILTTRKWNGSAKEFSRKYVSLGQSNIYSARFGFIRKLPIVADIVASLEYPSLPPSGTSFREGKEKHSRRKERKRGPN